MPVGPQHGLAGRIAGEVDSDAPGLSHEAGQLRVERDHGHVRVPAQPTAEGAANELGADGHGVIARDVELGVAEMQHVDPLGQQRFDLVGHLRGAPRANGRAFGQRIGAVDAMAIAASLGLQPALPAFFEVGGVVDAVARGREGQVFRPGRGVPDETAVVAPEEPRHASEAFVACQFGQECDDRLLAVAANAEVGAGALDDALGEYGKADPTEHDRGAAGPPHLREDLFQLREERLGAGPEAVVDVPKRDPDQGRTSGFEIAGQRARRIVGQAQIEDIDLTAGLPHGAGDVVQSDRPDGGGHPVGVDQRQRAARTQRTSPEKTVARSDRGPLRRLYRIGGPWQGRGPAGRWTDEPVECMVASLNEGASPGKRNRKRQGCLRRPRQSSSPLMHSNGIGE